MNELLSLEANLDTTKYEKEGNVKKVKVLSDEYVIGKENLVLKLYINLLNASTKISQSLKNLGLNSELPVSLKNITDQFSENLGILNRGFLEKRKPTQEERRKISTFFKTEVDFPDRSLEAYFNNLPYFVIPTKDIVKNYEKLKKNKENAGKFAKLFKDSPVISHFTSHKSLKTFLELTDDPIANICDLYIDAFGNFEIQFKLISTIITRIVTEIKLEEINTKLEVENVKKTNKIMINPCKKTPLYPKRLIRPKFIEEEPILARDLRNDSCHDIPIDTKPEKQHLKNDAHPSSGLLSSHSGLGLRGERLKNTLKEFLDLENKIKFLRRAESRAKSYKSDTQEMLKRPMRSDSLPQLAVTMRLHSNSKRDKSTSRIRNIIDNSTSVLRHNL